MRERVLRFGETATLVGILTEPDLDVRRTDVPAVVLLNSGILHHVGASRLYVQIARHLAECGCTSLRFDFSGIGDSEPRRDSLPFEESALVEAREAMDYVSGVAGTSEFVLIGLCSGADMSYFTAVNDEHVVGVAQLDASYIERLEVRPGPVKRHGTHLSKGTWVTVGTSNRRRSMPFAETHVMEEKKRFIEEAHRSVRSFAAVCDRYGISRKTGYKWMDRWRRAGPVGLESRASRPRHCPWATPREVVEAILEVRRKYEDFGPKKIRWYLETNRPELALPSRQTMHNILVRHDLVPRRRRRVRRWHPGRPDTDASEPNGTWTADFKGEFPMGDGELCYPLTVQDMHSRFVLECWGRPDVTIDSVIPVFTRLFRRYGLPERIRTDNGTPFASNALGRLSRLSVWFIQVGILPELIEPGCPQQNGKHENMHLVLKRRTTRPPSSNMRTQQRAFREFRKLYNEIRPHEALDGKVPADLYRPSPRPFPKQLEPVTYPGHFETRLVSTNGGIRWYGDRVPVGRLFAGHEVGLEEIDHGLFEVYFGPIWLGRFVEPKRLIFDSLGRGQRRTIERLDGTSASTVQKSSACRLGSMQCSAESRPWLIG